MSVITLNPVRYYTNQDVYHYTVDNRPLSDLASNDAVLEEAIETLDPALAPTAQPLSGQEKVTVLQNGQYVAAEISSISAFFNASPVVQVSTFASLPPSPLGLYLVLNDETKNNVPIFYLFTATHRFWIAMIQDA
jgi:hypothetical protein